MQQQPHSSRGPERLSTGVPVSSGEQSAGLLAVQAHCGGVVVAGRERVREGTAGRPVREELLAYLKREQVEPPARDRIRRIIGTALRQAEQALTTRIASRVPAEAAARMRALIAWAADPDDQDDAGPGDGALFGAAEVAGTDVFTAVRDEPGNVSVKTIGQETLWRSSPSAAQPSTAPWTVPAAGRGQPCLTSPVRAVVHHRVDGLLKREASGLLGALEARIDHRERSRSQQ